MSRVQTIRLDISSDEAFLPCLVKFIFDATKTVGFSEFVAKNVKIGMSNLLTEKRNSTSVNKISFECQYDFPHVSLALLDSKGNKYEKRDFFQ